MSSWDQKPPAPSMRLLSVGHFGRPAEDEIAWKEKFRILKFSVLPCGASAHGAAAATQAREFEIEVFYGVEDGGAFRWAALSPRCVVQGGATYVVGAAPGLPSDVVADRVAIRGTYAKACLAVYGERPEAAAAEEAPQTRGSAAAELRNPPASLYDESGAGVDEHELSAALLDRAGDDALAAPDLSGDDGDGDGDVDLITACAGAPAGALDALEAAPADARVPWDAVVAAVARALKGAPADAAAGCGLAAAALERSADPTVLADALVDTVAGVAGAILGDAAASPKRAEAAAAAVAALAAASPSAAKTVAATCYAALVTRLVMEKPRPSAALRASLGDAARRLALVDGLARLRASARGALETPRSWLRLRDGARDLDAVAALMGGGAALDPRCLDAALAERLAASAAALAGAAAAARAAARDGDAAGRLDAAAATRPLDGALRKVVATLRGLEGGGALWALCPKSSRSFGDLCDDGGLATAVRLDAGAFALARSLATAPEDDVPGAPSLDDVLLAARRVVEFGDVYAGDAARRALGETPGCVARLVAVAAAGGEGGAAQHALALLAELAHASPSPCAAALRGLAAHRAAIHGAVAGDGAGSEAAVLMIGAQRAASSLAREDAKSRLVVLLRATAAGGPLDDDEDDDDALPRACAGAAAAVAVDVGEAEAAKWGASRAGGLGDAERRLVEDGEPAAPREAHAVATVALRRLRDELRVGGRRAGALRARSLDRRLLSPEDAGGLFRVLDEAADRLDRLRGDLPRQLAASGRSEDAGAKVACLARRCDVLDDDDDDVDDAARDAAYPGGAPVDTESALAALLRALESACAAAGLLDELLKVVRRTTADWRDEASALACLLRVVNAVDGSFGPDVGEAKPPLECDDDDFDAAVARSRRSGDAAKTRLAVAGRALRGAALDLLKYWAPRQAGDGDEVVVAAKPPSKKRRKASDFMDEAKPAPARCWSPARLLAAIGRFSCGRPDRKLGGVSALDACVPAAAPVGAFAAAAHAPDGAGASRAFDDEFPAVPFGGEDDQGLEIMDAKHRRVPRTASRAARAAGNWALRAALDGRRGAHALAARAADAAEREARARWDGALADAAPYLAPLLCSCVESGAADVQALGCGVLSRCVDAGPRGGAAYASYLLLETKAAVAAAKSKQPLELMDRAGDDAHLRRAAAFCRVEGVAPWTRAARLLVGLREACHGPGGRTALFACGAPFALLDALAVPKPEVLRLALDALAALLVEMQERTACDDHGKTKAALDALLSGLPPPEGRAMGHVSSISGTFLAAATRALAKILAKYHKADLGVHFAAARCLGLLGKEKRNGAKVLRALATPGKDGLLLKRVLAGLRAALDNLAAQGATAAPPAPEDDMVAPLKKTMRRDRSRAARELDRRAAKLLRACAWVARCPASLAWDARVGHGKVCEVVGDFDAVEALERAVAFFDGLHDAAADDDDPEAAAWKGLCRDVGDDAFGSTRDYARVALRALRDLRDLRDGSALDEDAHACVEISHWFGGSPPNFRTL